MYVIYFKRLWCYFIKTVVDYKYIIYYKYPVMVFEIVLNV